MFTEKFVGRLADAKPEASTGKSRKVKLGRAKTRLAGSRAFIKIASRDPKPKTIYIIELWKEDAELKSHLADCKSVGDAMCGNPAPKNPDSRGLGMRRRDGGRDLVVDDVNVSLAVRCLRDAGWSDLAIAELAGRDTEQDFEQWVATLPVRQPEPATDDGTVDAEEAREPAGYEDDEA